MGRNIAARPRPSSARWGSPLATSIWSCSSTRVRARCAGWHGCYTWYTVAFWSEQQMKVIELHDAFGVGGLKLVERPDPVPGTGQVVLKMRAFSINYRDLLVVNGVGRWKPSLPRVPLSDGVGIVMAIGGGVSRVKVGDRVAPIFYPNWLDGRAAVGKMDQALGGASADGVLAEYTLVEQ